MVEDLFMQFLIVLIPPVCFQFILTEDLFHKLSTIRIISGLLAGFAVVICMTFPVGSVNTALWDFRFVTIVVSSLYGGFLSGSIVSGVMLIFQLYLGGGELLYELAALLLYAPLPLALSVKFYEFTSRQRLLITLGTGILAFWIETGSNALYSNTTRLSFIPYNQGPLYLFLFFTIVVLSILVNVMMIENVIEKYLLRHEVQLSEKLKIVSQIAASVAHEVRNPLTVIRGFLQLMRNSLDEKNKGYMKMIVSELDRAQLIINDYLNLAKPYPENAAIFDVSEMLEHSIQMLSSYGVMHNAELLLNTEKGLWVRTEQAKFNQVMINLIKNGIEAIEHSGKVDIEASRSGNDIMIIIADTGRGMSDEQLSQIGTPFFTTKENGTGLGLIVTIRMVEAMDGKIAFESETGKGTCATIKLPAAEHALESETEALDGEKHSQR